MNALVHFIKAGGLVMYPLLVLSLMAVVVIVERLLAFRQYGSTAPGLLLSTITACRAGNYFEATKLCEKRQGPLAHCLLVILKNRQLPVREVERLIEETGQDYFIRLEKLLPVLDTTTTISPLLGLLGTIVGMIGTFNAISISAQQAHTNGGGDAVLAGVGEALYATASGILIAVVCFVAYNYFVSRLRSITAETEQAATKLINLLTELHHAERSDNNHATQANSTKGVDIHGIQEKARA